MSVRTRSRTRTSTIVILIWLLIGVFAAVQRGYFGTADPSCSRLGSAVLTVVAGPLNYFGLNPKVGCSTPEPSKSVDVVDVVDSVPEVRPLDEGPSDEDGSSSVRLPMTGRVSREQVAARAGGPQRDQH